MLEKRKVRDSKWRSVVMREKTILAGLPPHPNVITLYQTFQDDERLFMLMEIAFGGELYKLLKRERRCVKVRFVDESCFLERAQEPHAHVTAKHTCRLPGSSKPLQHSTLDA